MARVPDGMSGGVTHPTLRRGGAGVGRREVVVHLAAALLGTVAVATALAVLFTLPWALPGKAFFLGALAGIAVWPVLSALGPGFRFRPADRVTLLRACLVLVLLAMVGESQTPGLAAVAVGLAAVAAALDAVDGWLARRTASASAFGARFDMETDAALVLVLALLAWQWQKAGAWILLAGMLRYLFAAAAALLPWMRRALPTSRRRRTVCAVQVVALIACLVPAVVPPYSALMAGAGLLALLSSFTIDICWLAARARPETEFART